MRLEPKEEEIVSAVVMICVYDNMIQVRQRMHNKNNSTCFLKIIQPISQNKGIGTFNNKDNNFSS